MTDQPARRPGADYSVPRRTTATSSDPHQSEAQHPSAETARNIRADIEGLRALAVLPILLFHLEVSYLPGGFVGVDIFFVISGFLIGGMTIREVRAGTFSLATFYQRRLRRIAPALLVTVLATLAVGAVLLLPSDFEALASSSLPSLLFVANMYFWWTTDYFSEEAYTTPLLHLWSLGIEEQFYLFFPLIAVAISRVHERLLWPGLVLIAGSSLLLSWHYVHVAPQADFFLLPMRAWELLGGVLVAITPLGFLRWRILREAIAALGAALIVWSFIKFDHYTPFPGWLAIIPCAGTAAIIAAGSYGPTVVGQCLGTAIARFFGKISYSLYLVHWPVIVFLAMALPSDTFTFEMQIAAGGISILLSVMSWYFVETPLRATKAPLRTVAGWSGAATAALAAMAIGVLATGGWPARYSPDVQRIAAALEYPQSDVLRAGSCFLINDEQVFDQGQCLAVRHGAPRVVLLGDSHAAHLWPGLSQEFSGSAILQMTASGCRPLIVQDGYISKRCRDLVAWALDTYIPNNPPDLLILAGFWKPEDLPGLDKTLAYFNKLGQRVLLIGPVPAWTLRVPRLLALGEMRGDPTLADRFLRSDRAALDREMAEISARHNVSYVSAIKTNCPNGCRYFGPSGNPLIVDDSHLTAEGSALFAATLHDPALRQ